MTPKLVNLVKERCEELLVEAILLIQHQVDALLLEDTHVFEGGDCILHRFNVAGLKIAEDLVLEEGLTEPLDPLDDLGSLDSCGAAIFTYGHREGVEEGNIVGVNHGPYQRRYKQVEGLRPESQNNLATFGYGEDDASSDH